jgi:hypothetical protein
MTGSALLAGVELNHAAGMLMLGAAFAWLAGSEIASRVCSNLRILPGRLWPWLRLQIAAVIAACVLVIISVWSSFSYYVVFGALSIVGLLLSPFRKSPATNRWVKMALWIIAAVVFFSASAGVLHLDSTANNNAGRIGTMAVDGWLAFLIGTWWLEKGQQLVLNGITGGFHGTDQPTEPKSTIWVYGLLVLGVFSLIALLGVLTFSGFSQSVLPFDSTAPANPTLSVAIGVMLLAWWPFACWKTILVREPNSLAANLRRHTRVTVACGVFFTVVISTAVTFGVQNGHDRVMTTDLSEGSKEFQELAARIGSIKFRNLKTAQDYIDAYGEIDPLMADFERKLLRYIEISNRARDREQRRGPFNIQRFYKNNTPEFWRNNSAILEVLRQECYLTKQQIAVAYEMTSLSREDQVPFWGKRFKPLLEQENGLRQQLAALQAKIAPTTTAK